MNKCTLCDLEGCEKLTKKIFHLEHPEDKSKIIENITYSCCYDNKHKDYCDFCLSSPKVRQMIINEPVPLREPKIRNVNPYSKVMKI